MDKIRSLVAMALCCACFANPALGHSGWFLQTGGDPAWVSWCPTQSTRWHAYYDGVTPTSIYITSPAQMQSFCFNSFKHPGINNGHLSMVYHDTSSSESDTCSRSIHQPDTPTDPTYADGSLWYVQECYDGFFGEPPTGAEGGSGGNRGETECCSGNPVNTATGNKFQRERDYEGKGDLPLNFDRYYNSEDNQVSALGRGWRLPYSRSLRKDFGNPPTYNPAKHTPVKPSQQEACVQGWDAIKASVPGLSTATASYSGGTCNLLIGSVVKATMPIYAQNPQPKTTLAAIYAERDDGKVYRFTVSGANFTQNNDVTGRLTSISGGYRYTENDIVEDYDSSGQLVSITNKNGTTIAVGHDGNGRLTSVSSRNRTLTIGYDANGRVGSLTDPDLKVTNYGYNASTGDLETVTYPNSEYKTYHYGEGEPANYSRLLTGIDENGHRYATWSYDDAGRAESSEHGEGLEKADRVDLTFNANGTVVVKDALLTERTYAFTNVNGVFRLSSITKPCPGCATSTSTTTTTYASGYKDLVTDYNGNVTDYDFNVKGLESQRIEAKGTALQRTIVTTWNQDFRVPDRIDELGRRTDFTYWPNGLLHTKTVTDTATGNTRTTTYTYTPTGQSYPAGLLDTVDGPRTDVNDITDYDYDAQGNLTQITNALNQVTQIPEYDAHGNPKKIIDPNGVVTLLTYDERQRLKTRTVNGDQTVFAYDGAGQLDRVTLPDGSYLDYDYNAAHQLTDIRDNLNNRIHYTPDAMGNRTKEEVFDPSNTLRRKRSQVFNALGQLYQIKNAAGTVVTEYGYDENGNRTSETSYEGTDAFTTTKGYDPLNRLETVVDPDTNPTSDPTDRTTRYGYDALDQLTSVKDPSNLLTTYTINALGDRGHQDSPDTGSTGYTYDSGGNQQSETNADGFTRTFTYDALNRVLTRVGDIHDQVTYHYDGTNYVVPMPYGVGRLTGVEDASGVYTYRYDSHGNLAEETKRVRSLAGAFISGAFVTSYGYDAADRLKSITYPTGRVVTYLRDAIGNLLGVTTTDSAGTQTLASGGLHAPFGAITDLTLGNGAIEQWNYNLNNRLEHLEVGSVLDLTYGFDNRGNITGVTDALGADRAQTLGYDQLSRLTGAQGSYGTLGYTYNPTGDRLTRTRNGNSSGYSYNPDTHQLVSVSGDDQSSYYSYNGRGQALNKRTDHYLYTDTGGWLYQVNRSLGTTTPIAQYVYNAQNQRVLSTYYVMPTSASVMLVSHYDREGQLIAETCPDGRVVAEYAYAEGKPLAMWAIRRDGTSTWPDSAVSICSTPGVTYDLTYDSNANTTALFHFDQEDVTPPLMTHTTPDSGPSGLKGTFEGAVLPTLVLSPAVGFGNALRFDGVQRDPAADQRVVVPASSSHGLAGKQEWVLDLRVTPQVRPQYQNERYVIAERLTPTPTPVLDWQLALARPTNNGAQSDDAVAFVFRYRGSNGSTIEITFGATTWTQLKDKTRHIRIEFDRAQAIPLLFFVDDVLAGSNGDTAHATPLSYPLRIGSSALYPRAWGGVIDELHISGTDVVAQHPTATDVVERELFYYANDHLGAPQKLLDQDQAVVWDAVYEPFGEVTFKTQHVLNNLRLPGQYFDAQFSTADTDELNGLYYNWHRTYDPNIGRYLQSDPIGFRGGLNTYAYVAGNPLKRIDPYGLCSCENSAKQYPNGAPDFNPWFWQAQDATIRCNYKCTSDKGANFMITTDVQIHQKPIILGGDPNLDFVCPYVNVWYEDIPQAPWVMQTFSNATFDPRDSADPDIKKQGEQHCKDCGGK